MDRPSDIKINWLAFLSSLIEPYSFSIYVYSSLPYMLLLLMFDQFS